MGISGCPKEHISINILNQFEQMKKINLKSFESDSLVLNDLILTSSSCHPKIFVKEFSYFLMPCHQHGLRINLLVQR